MMDFKQRSKIYAGGGGEWRKSGGHEIFLNMKEGHNYFFVKVFTFFLVLEGGH